MFKLMKGEDKTTYLVHDDYFEHFIDFCEVYCVFGCCGFDSCDFSPLHISGFLCSESRSESTDGNIVSVTAIAERLASLVIELKRDFGSNGLISNGYQPEFLSESYPGKTIDKLCDDISAHLDIALSLIDVNQRYENNGSRRYLTLN